MRTTITEAPNAETTTIALLLARTVHEVAPVDRDGRPLSGGVGS